jgi:hypothetical protein
MKRIYLYFIAILSFNMLVAQSSNKNTLFEIEKIVNRIQLPSIPNYKI